MDSLVGAFLCLAKQPFHGRTSISAVLASRSLALMSSS